MCWCFIQIHGETMEKKELKVVFLYLSSSYVEYNKKRNGLPNERHNCLWRQYISLYSYDWSKFIIQGNSQIPPVLRHVSSRLPLAVKPASTEWRLLLKKTWRDSLPIDMLLSAVSVVVVAQPSSEFPGGLMNYPVFFHPYLSS